MEHILTVIAGVAAWLLGLLLYGHTFKRGGGRRRRR